MRSDIGLPKGMTPDQAYIQGVADGERSAGMTTTVETIDITPGQESYPPQVWELKKFVEKAINESRTIQTNEEFGRKLREYIGQNGFTIIDSTVWLLGLMLWPETMQAARNFRIADLSVKVNTR